MGLDPSGSTALVHALAPRVAIMQNGTRKGGTVQTMQTLHTSPGLEDIWQLHWAYNAGIEHNPSGAVHREHRRSGNDRAGDHGTARRRTRNGSRRRTASGSASQGAAPGQPAGHLAGGRPAAGRWRGGHTGPANLIKVSAQDDGTFTVTNTRKISRRRTVAEGINRDLTPGQSRSADAGVDRGGPTSRERPTRRSRRPVRRAA